jgi:lipoprotein Spr
LRVHAVQARSLARQPDVLYDLRHSIGRLMSTTLPSGIQVTVPLHFQNVLYNGGHYPGAPGVRGLEGGANCQQYAYELIRYYGRVIPDFRSSELQADETYTCAVETLEPLDLLLFHNRPAAWGAHVGVYLGCGQIIHLSKQIGRPVLWTFAEFAGRAEYACYIGAKRALVSCLSNSPPDLPHALTGNSEAKGH